MDKQILSSIHFNFNYFKSPPHSVILSLIFLSLPIINMRKARLAVRNQSVSKVTQPKENVDQANKKQVEQLEQLLLEQDFTVDQLYQTIKNSKQKQTLFSKLNKRKLQKFFAQHYKFLIQSQQELSQMQIPRMDEIKKMQHAKISQNLDIKTTGEQIRESSVLEIIDSFNNSLFDGDFKEGLRILGIIKQMSASERYQKYFIKLDIIDMFRQSYQNWVQSCNQQEHLVSAQEIKAAVRLFLNGCTNKIVGDLSTELSMGTLDTNVIGRLMSKLLKNIQQVINQFKQRYGKYSDKLNVYAYSSNWIQTISQQYYNMIQEYIFEKDQLLEILSLLNRILTTSADLESRGITVSRIFKKLLCKDLLTHYDRFIQVVLDAFESDLKQDDNLYEMTHFHSFRTFGEQLACLREAQNSDVSKIISTKKAILLINTYYLLLEPIYDQKWEFLHKKILSLLCEKSSTLIYNNQLQIWDYLNLYNFFLDLSKGKIRKKVYDNFTEQYKNQVKQSIADITAFSKTCQQKFEELLLQQYFYKFLIFVPKHLWENGKTYAAKQQNPQKVSTLIPILLKIFKQFFIQYFYRLPKVKIENLVTDFYKYFLYVLQYVLYTVYHKQGTNEAVFILPQKDKDLFLKAKMFKIQNISEIQDQKIFKLAYMSLFGMKTFILDMYAFALGINTFYKLSHPVSPEMFLSKLVKIQQKQKREPAVDFQKQNFKETLKNFEQKLNSQDYRVSRQQQQVKVIKL